MIVSLVANFPHANCGSLYKLKSTFRSRVLQRSKQGQHPSVSRRGNLMVRTSSEFQEDSTARGLWKDETVSCYASLPKFAAEPSSPSSKPTAEASKVFHESLDNFSTDILDSYDEPQEPTQYEPAPTIGKLSQDPDLTYVLRELTSLYAGADGGSVLVRRHFKQVKSAMRQLMAADPALQLTAPASKPVCIHLPRVLNNAMRQPTAPCVMSLSQIWNRLTWEYGYEKMPHGLAKSFAYADIVGPHGLVPCEALVVGLVLLGPRATYPSHSHEGIVESYVSLSGSWSENELSVYTPGSTVINPPSHPHRLTTCPSEPCLLAYAWTAAPDADGHWPKHHILHSPKTYFLKKRRKQTG